MIIYAVLKHNCYLCTSINKYLNYLNAKSDIFTYINYYPSIEYILINYRESHNNLVLKFPKIFLFYNNKSYDITTTIINDSIEFDKLLEQIDYKNLNINKFVKKIIPLKEE